MGRAIFLACVLVLIALASGRAVAAEWPTRWQSEALREHPLVGRIYATHSGKFLSPKTYLQSLTWPRFVLLGEVHDNPDHHILQALALKHMGAKLSVVFEHFHTDQQAVIDAFHGGHKWMGTAGGDNQIERFFLVTGWAGSGWPSKKIYKPLIATTLRLETKLLAGSPPKNRVRDVARRGVEALSQDALRRLHLEKPLGAKASDALLDELEASHCGLMPKSAFGNMAVAQRMRDGHMARVMVDATLNEGPVALIAGNGHVRWGRGVPWYIRQMIPEADRRPLLTVSHVEVVEGKNAPRDYDLARQQRALLIFTPAKVRPDPCEAMRKRFGKTKRQ